jgi:hypothetical protein
MPGHYSSCGVPACASESSTTSSTTARISSGVNPLLKVPLGKLHSERLVPLDPDVVMNFPGYGPDMIIADSADQLVQIGAPKVPVPGSTWSSIWP